MARKKGTAAAACALCEKNDHLVSRFQGAEICRLCAVALRSIEEIRSNVDNVHEAEKVIEAHTLWNDAVAKVQAGDTGEYSALRYAQEMWG